MRATHVLMVMAAAWIVGCGGSGADGGAAPSGLVERCAGTYKCVIGSETEMLELHRDSAGACVTGASDAGASNRTVVNADGTLTTPNGSKLTWQGDASRFQLCSGPICVECSNVAEGSASLGSTTSGTGHCRGSARSCSGISASSCYEQLGCSYSVGISLSTSDDECTGSPTDCEDISGEKLCKEQRGCRWEVQ